MLKETLTQEPLIAIFYFNFLIENIRTLQNLKNLEQTYACPDNDSNKNSLCGVEKKNSKEGEPEEV